MLVGIGDLRKGDLLDSREPEDVHVVASIKGFLFGTGRRVTSIILSKCGSFYHVQTDQGGLQMAHDGSVWCLWEARDPQKPRKSGRRLV